jgi:hypothetical protein
MACVSTIAHTRKITDDRSHYYATLVAICADYRLSRDTRILAAWLLHEWNVYEIDRRDIRATSRETGLSPERIRECMSELAESGWLGVKDHELFFIEQVPCEAVHPGTSARH